ncbi:MAG: nitroreductase [Candidatus Omnitrophica bacterium]|nr:nitroreductase [Candidatus Omnitrophota bacterium]
MDLVEAIRQRKSIRAFKPDAIEKDMLVEIIEQAQRAPSWANTQPWEFVVVTGAKLKAIQDAFVKRGPQGMQASQSEVARPYDFPEPYISRIKSMQVKENKGRTSQATPEEMAARMNLNFRHYGAPCCIYLVINKNFVYQEKGVNVWSLYDSGSAVQNLMLLAVDNGLGTIAQAMAVVYPDIILKELGISADKVIALGIAIGYPDWDNDVNDDYRDRVPLDEITTFYGF